MGVVFVTAAPGTACTTLLLGDLDEVMAEVYLGLQSCQAPKQKQKQNKKEREKENKPEALAESISLSL